MLKVELDKFSVRSQWNPGTNPAHFELLFVVFDSLSLSNATLRYFPLKHEKAERSEKAEKNIASLKSLVHLYKSKLVAWKP